ncbi:MULTISPECIES: DUF1826 domain-containing protein [Pseudomonas]|jgi:Protein of unknown function (DUF1826)|uniref:DUF1826 domain-containing protein n=3 Tax=Pseudomonas TaxID=286 RepID=A0A1L7NM03_PSEPU|nr:MULTISPECIES: DUF1826 domain-containing protein [Pseudomonas]ERT16912.1 hypothetical protein O162_20425 [Pseudomonas putida SJ3]AGN81192.1 hypothetical protein L483_31940 [Pseudomonas putida H8234]MBP2080234.1 hypothetical protein [Pseudomonas sp. PvP089]MBP2088150.1 hypothetical protein [Pseudomonas sp. PvP088]MBP2225530.1 hypothetical protein [Pseudomonas putida]
MNQALKPVDIFQVFGETPLVLTDVLQDGVNLAVWRRRLPPQLEDFAELVVSLGQPLSDQWVMDVDEQQMPVMSDLLREAADLQGYEAFVADVAWLVAAYTCLVGARRVGLRLRVLTGPMCPRFHVDNVPLRLLTTYAGPGSEWLREQESPRGELHTAQVPVNNIQKLHVGEVAVLKGEKWQGNEGAGLVHRSPSGQQGRLLLSLDWLA